MGPIGLEQMRETCSSHPALTGCDSFFMVTSYDQTTYVQEHINLHRITLSYYPRPKMGDLSRLYHNIGSYAKNQPQGQVSRSSILHLG